MMGEDSQNIGKSKQKSQYWRDLEIWQLGHGLVLDIYRIVSGFPSDEKYSLGDQIKRAAVSIPANIVEGHSRNSKKELIRFCFISRGSLEELRYFIQLAADLKYITTSVHQDIEKKLIKISVKLNNFIHSLKQ